MVRILSIVAFCAIIVVGCARIEPVLPSDTSQNPALTQAWKPGDGPFRLWGEWGLYINDNHDNVVAVPKRGSRFHLNALKFLESYCTDCLKIVGLSNNGDGTVNLTVRITHPFPGHPEYTGFDVKGIMMFNGSDVFDTRPKYPMYPKYYVSSRMLGDPEILNPDGFTYRWSPWYDSGSDLPIFNYWEGKFAHGTPTANINAYLNFYSTEERHAFYCDTSVSRTYRLSLPTGPITAGYAIEACWEPPTTMPVNNPLTDFPVTANTPEPYYFKMVVNDGNPITDPDCCNCITFPPTVHEFRAEYLNWYVPEDAYENPHTFVAFWDQLTFGGGHENGTDSFPADGPDNWLVVGGLHPDWYENGLHKYIGVFWWPGPEIHVVCPVITSFEFTVDL